MPEEQPIPSGEATEAQIAPEATPTDPSQSTQTTTAEFDENAYPWLTVPIGGDPSPSYSAPPVPPQYQGYPPAPPAPYIPPTQMPQYAYQAPPPPPPMPQQRPLSVEDFARDPAGSIQNLAREAVLPIMAAAMRENEMRNAQREAVQRAEITRQNEARAVTAFEKSRQTLRERYKDLARTSTFRNPAVQQRFDAAVRGYLQRGLEIARREGDMSYMEHITKPATLRAVLSYIENDLGVAGDGSSLQMQGAFTEMGRRGPETNTLLTDEDRDANREISARFGVDYRTREKQMEKALMERRKRGWE